MKNLEKIFEISSLQTLFIVFYLIVSMIVIFTLFAKKIKWNMILIISLSIGILGGVSTYFLNINSNVTVGEVHSWLNMFPSIFIYFILFFSPFLFGIKIIHLFLCNNRNRKFDKKTILNIIIVFSIVIIIIPLLSFIVFDKIDWKGLLPYPTENIGLITWLFSNNINVWYWSLLIFIIIVFLSTTTGFTLYLLKEKKDKAFEQTTDVFSGLKMLLETCVYYISKLLPLVIISVIPLMFISHSLSLGNIKSLLIFFGIFFIFSIILISILWLINKKDKFVYENITLLLHALFFPLVVSIISYLNYQTIDTKLIIFIVMLFIVSGINYLTFYKELEHGDNFVETSMEKSSIIVLGSFTLISSTYLYLLIAKPIYEIIKIIFLSIVKPSYETIKNKASFTLEMEVNNE